MIDVNKENRSGNSKAEKKYVKAPWPIFIFQWTFIALMCYFSAVQLPMGPFGLPWNTFIVSWLSFIVLIVTSFGYIYYNKQKED